MKNKWIKKGDKVRVIAGNDNGKIGEVIARREDRILIQGVNIRKRHTKSRDQNRTSEIVSMEMPIHISNIALCDAEGKKLKLKVQIDKEGGKQLISIRDGKEVSHRTLRKPGKI